MTLSIIIPVYNEAERVGELLQRLLAVPLAASTTGYEVLVVDDGSTDGTAQVVAQLAQQHPQVRLVQHPHNRGKGAAVKTGAQHAVMDALLVQDADLELVPEDIPHMLEAMQRLKVRFVNGSRYLPGMVRPVHGLWRYVFNKLFTALTSIFVNARLTDMACGYKLVERNFFNQLNLKEDRFGFEAELIIKALKVDRVRVCEVPVQYFPRNRGEGKKLRNWDGFKVLGKILYYGIFHRPRLMPADGPPLPQPPQLGAD